MLGTPKLNAGIEMDEAVVPIATVRKKYGRKTWKVV